MPGQHTPKPVHRVRGVDHAAFPTFDPNATVRFYRPAPRSPASISGRPCETG